MSSGAHVKASENSGARLWREAKKLIPGGGGLLSKRSEMFLPDQWPSYYQKARGVEIWDLDGQHYWDLSIMGMGTCVLGYAHPGVNEAVKTAIDQGSMSTFNCPEEVELARGLIQLHPWAAQARFARTGGEACAIAARIARAHKRKDKILFCGYHGWTDWYLSANLGNEKHLDGQLLPGLSPVGIPRGLKDSSLPFTYGDLKSLEDQTACHKGEIAAIFLEFARHHEPDLAFVRGVRDVAKRIGAVLIYDEITSGFRMRAGGMHMLYDLSPDIVVLGKAMGNGFPISAILGRAEVMESAQDTFISSTYWTERTGFAAANEVIRQFRKLPIPKHLEKMGTMVQEGLIKIIAETDLGIQVGGLKPAPILMNASPDALVVKTLFTQEMLKRDFLASTVIYLSWAHTPEIIERYLQAAKEVLTWIDVQRKKGNLESFLEGPVCQSGFKRLN